MDWRYPPEDLQFPIILASDLIYEMRNVAPLVALIRKMLAPGGTCLLTDQDRVPSHVFARHVDIGGTILHDQDHACRRTGRPASQGHALPRYSLGLSKHLSIFRQFE